MQFLNNVFFFFLLTRKGPGKVFLWKKKRCTGSLQHQRAAGTPRIGSTHVQTRKRGVTRTSGTRTRVQVQEINKTEEEGVQREENVFQREEKMCCESVTIPARHLNLAYFACTAMFDKRSVG